MFEDTATSVEVAEDHRALTEEDLLGYPHKDLQLACVRAAVDGMVCGNTPTVPHANQPQDPTPSRAAARDVNGWDGNAHVTTPSLRPFQYWLCRNGLLEGTWPRP